MLAKRGPCSLKEMRNEKLWADRRGGFMDEAAKKNWNDKHPHVIFTIAVATAAGILMVVGTPLCNVIAFCAGCMTTDLFIAPYLHRKNITLKTLANRFRVKPAAP
jgi:hypothetical protein